jgi:valyl-tRNA synthetase
MIDDKYDFKAAEAKWQDQWQRSGLFSWNADEPKENSYIIDTPPPTVSGFLHIGHVYSYTQTDLIARYKRMAGSNVFYPMGFDDNGLPSERLVETTRKIRASDMSREEFIRICYEVVRAAEDDFRTLFKRIALSVDWSLEYQTISPRCRKISQLSALDLFAKEQLYRQLQPTLWDPADRTALAQAEVVEKEMAGTMWEISFRLEHGSDVTIATTRPELLGACCALLIHPDHPRRLELEQVQAISPLYGVPIPILVDPQVDPHTGSGIVMCCTFGDTTDVEWWRRYKLPLRVIIDKSGRFTAMDGIGGPDWPSLDLAGARMLAASLAGLNIRDARQKIVATLQERGHLGSEKPIRRMVPCAERSGAPLEILVTPQWFVRTLDKKEALLEKGRRIRWFPDYMQARYESWVENLKWDWCISRQRYFGVPFPFWYSKRQGEEGRIIAAHPDDLPVNPLVDLPRGYGSDEVLPDPDVMDTWATSSVSPQINSYGVAPGLVIDPERYRKLFPATLRPQSHEIIRTWAFYTILKSYLHENKIPWQDIAISGWCLAPDKSKMSKSKGNVVTPESLLDRYGADVLRYWTATSRLGVDTALSEDVLKVGKRLVTKLWNASRFVELQLHDIGAAPETPRADFEHGRIIETFDRWILSRLAEAVTNATEANDVYEYASALRVIERFFWTDLCDNYLELIKGRAYGDFGTSESQLSARYTLWHCLDTVLRLFAPILPHITEEIYSQMFSRTFATVHSIHARGTWPKPIDQLHDAAAEKLGSVGVSVLAAVRKLKTNRNLSLKKPLLWCNVAPTENGAALTPDALDELRPDLMHAIGTNSLTWNDAQPPVGTVDAINTHDDALRVEVVFAD